MNGAPGKQRQGLSRGLKPVSSAGDGIAQAEAWAYLRNKGKGKGQYGDSALRPRSGQNDEQEQATTKCGGPSTALRSGRDRVRESGSRGARIPIHRMRQRRDEWGTRPEAVRWVMDSAVEKLVRLVIEEPTSKGSKAERVALWDSLSSEQRQQTTESRVFIRFANTTQLMADPFIHDNERPPRPDIRASIDGHDCYFELGEILDEQLAKNINRTLKTGMASGCALSQIDPLMKMLKQKCEKKYEIDDTPMDLLLYYWRQGPYQPVVDDYLFTNRRNIEESLRNSQFDKIWIYNWDLGKVLWQIEAKKKA